MNDLISRQAAIDAIDKALSRTFVEPCGEMILKDLPSAQPEQRWIPCSKRPPIAKHKTYWICTDTGYQCECRWTNVNHFWTDLTSKWHWHIMDIPQYSKVVAWRELPEPYREEGECE